MKKGKLDRRGERKTYNGKYHVRNPQRYKGDASDVLYRSSWEHACCKFLDDDPRVEWWNSEEFVVPYWSDLDKKRHRYFVDFVVKWKSGKTTLIEVKPKRQTQPPKRKNLQETYTFVRNMNKWEAADRVAKDNGWEFVIWTEEELKKYGILKKQPGKLNPLPRYKKKKKLT